MTGQDDKTRTQWACQITWPDGHTEINKCYSRSVAEDMAERHAALGKTTCVLRRTVIKSEWTEVAPLRPSFPTFSLDPLDDNEDPTVVTPASRFQR